MKHDLLEPVGRADVLASLFGRVAFYSTRLSNSVSSLLIALSHLFLSQEVCSALIQRTGV